MVEVVANIKYNRASPRKLRELARAVKKLSLEKMILQLKFSPKRVAEPLLEALQSAVANAKNNLKLEEGSLKVNRIEIGEGPRFKRWRAVSRGQAHEYKKRTSHIKVVLEEKELRGTKN